MQDRIDSPALHAYLGRIGAELLSFRKAMVKEFSKSGKHYYRERTFIKIGSDGSIDCNGTEEQQPTKEEQAEIVREFKKIEMPTSIGASSAGLKDFIRKQGGDPSRFFAMRDRRNNTITMVQERIEKDDGTKFFVPWTYWSDGQWRKMEPDGKLPFWKPEGKRKSRIMIHEGCKAARNVTMMLEDRSIEHPWRSFLEDYEHWGMIGGALAPHRTEYQEVKWEKPEEVVYVCDNDFPGTSALRRVAQAYRGALKGIMFGKQFPASWDMGDPIPKSLMTSRGRYIGPKPQELMRTATWATDVVKVGKGRPSIHLREDFVSEWVHSVRPEVFIHKDWPNERHTANEFNSLVAPISDVDDTARLVKKDLSGKAKQIKYDPGKPPGIFGDDDGYINTHVPSLITPEEGDPGPWLDFMARLVPSEGDREELLRWCATLIARPDVKMNYGVLLISETQGIGKGTLGEKILAPIVGKRNTSFPSESDVVESNYNYWLSHKRLAVVHEIYAGHSSKAYNKLKSVITDNTITVSMKYQASYEIDNWIHVFACSNSMRAIQLSHDDRRWFVPKVTEEKQGTAYWLELNEWLTEKGGLGIICHWAREWLRENAVVEKGAPAPWSETKKEVIEEGYSAGMTMAAEFLSKVEECSRSPEWMAANTKPDKANGEWRESGVAILDKSLVEMIRFHIHDGRRSDRLEKPLTLRKVAKARKWYIHPENYARMEYNGHGRLICSEKAMTEVPIDELLKRTRLLDVRALAREWFNL